MMKWEKKVNNNLVTIFLKKEKGQKETKSKIINIKMERMKLHILSCSE